MQSVVKSIEHPDGLRKVEVFRRADGTFGFEALKWAEQEQCWLPYGRYADCFAASAEIAEREARGRVEWLDR